MNTRPLFRVGSLVFGTICALGFLAACSSSPSGSEWKRNGALMLARQLPAESVSTGQSYLGFMPFSGSTPKEWLLIDKEAGLARLMKGKTASASLPVTIPATLESGVYTVSFKQKNPIWYASDAYFEERNLPVPAEGSGSRYLKAALGKLAVFIGEEGLVLHSGNESAGGLRLEQSSLTKLFGKLSVGQSIVIR